MTAAARANSNEDGSALQAGDAAQRMRQMVQQHVAFVWRSLRRLGVPESEADDGVQQVFMVAMRRLPEIVTGRERAFLFATVQRIASRAHRTRRRRREQLDEDLDERSGGGIDPHALLDQAQTKEIVYQLLDRLAIEQRSVFVLYEIDGLTMAEIASMLDLKPGTVASRLRLAREQFANLVHRLQEGRVMG